MSNPRPAAVTFARLAAALVPMLMLAACASDTLEPSEERQVAAQVIGPREISAAVVDFAGVSRVEVIGGEGFAKTTGTGLRLVIVLYEPGDIELTLTLDGSSSASATLVDVADGDGAVASSLEGYRVDVGM